MTAVSDDISNNNRNPLRASSSNTDISANVSEENAYDKLMKNFEYSLIFIFAFIIFLLNFVAVSISLQCNKESNIFYKMASGLFAFMFGILYLIFNYYMYRVKVNNKPCVICKDDVFGLSTS